MRTLFAPIWLASTIVACSPVGPDYQAPNIGLETQFVGSGSSSNADATKTEWWKSLNDPLLTSLLERGSVQNIDIKSALERITAAQAALGLSGANAQTTGSVFIDGRERSDDPNTTDPSRGQINAQYVFDFAGGFRRGGEQSRANLDAAQADAGTVRLAYFAEITDSYIQARYFQAAAWITRETISTRRKTLEIVDQRLGVQDATELDSLRVQSELASAEAALPVLLANFESNVFRLATLVAEPASPLMAQMQRGASQPRPSGYSTVGIPADLLRNRPDIRFTERNLAAATAAIGVAEAQLYPSVALGGTLGTSSADRWSFGPTLTLPVFNRGILQANKKIAASEARQAELDWRKSVLIAVEEVQTALSLCRNWNRQLQFQVKAAEASARFGELSQRSYESGTITLTDVLDAERQHASNRLEVANALRRYTESWMRVQISTGKGWQAPALLTPAETIRPEPVFDPLGVDGNTDQAALAN